MGIEGSYFRKEICKYVTLFSIFTLHLGSLSGYRSKLHLDNFVSCFLQDAALASLKSLNKNDVVEVRAMMRPPDGVRMVIEAVCIMKGIKPKKVAGDKVLNQIRTFDFHIKFTFINIWYMCNLLWVESVESKCCSYSGL